MVSCPQHLAGLSLVEKVTAALLNPGSSEESGTVLLDLLGFDGWPASFTMNQLAAGWCFFEIEL